MLEKAVTDGTHSTEPAGFSHQLYDLMDAIEPKEKGISIQDFVQGNDMFYRKFEKIRKKEGY